MNRLNGNRSATYIQNRDFIDAILEGRQPFISVYDSVKTSMAVIAAMQSVKTGRPVSVPPVPDRSGECPRFRDYQAENRKGRLEHLKILNDLYQPDLF